MIPVALALILLLLMISVKNAQRMPTVPVEVLLFQIQAIGALLPLGKCPPRFFNVEKTVLHVVLRAMSMIYSLNAQKVMRE